MASVPAATESHYRLLAENSGDVVLWLSEDGRIRWVSPSLTAALGWAPAEWIGRLASDVLGQGGEGLGSGDHRERLRQGQTVLLRDQARGRDGGLHWVEIHASPFRRADGQREGVVATLRTIDAQVAAERELRLSEERHRLLADNAMDVIWTMAPDGTITYVSPAVEGVRGLTAAEAMVQPIIERADRYGHSLTLVLFDIDDFKGINDRFGHASGDQVLAELSRRVQGHLRSSDGLGRWGGEEFLVLLPECGGEQACELAEKLRRLVSATPFEGVGTVTASFGVAQRNPGETADAWFGRVDRALYRAKQRGRDRVELAAAGG